MQCDLRVEFKFKNAALLTRLKLKFGEDASTKSMAEDIGVPYGQLICLLTLHMKPFSSRLSRGAQSVDGVIYTPAAMKIANFLDFTEPAELFPASLYALKIPKKYHKDFESVQLLSFQEAREQKLLPPAESYEDNYEALGLKERMGQMLETLTAREAKVLRLKFGLEDGIERTYDEVAEALGGERWSIRQIEAKALRKLRHPSRAQKIKVFYTGEEPPPPKPVEEPVNPVVERIQLKITRKVNPEVREAVEVQVRAMPAAPKQLPPEVIAERRRQLVAKLTRFRKIKEHSGRTDRMVHAWDPVLKEFRLLPYSLVAEDNGARQRGEAEVHR